jgi:AcrR family transcriptional regulator
MAARKQTYDSPRQVARRASILEATRELIGKHGYEGTTVRGVAELAGVAKGTLYNIYGGKDELIFSAVLDVRDDIGDRILDLGPEPGLDSILKTNQAVMEEIVRKPTYAEAISRALFGAHSAKMLIPSLIAYPIRRTRKELETAQSLGQIEPDIDCAMLARQLEMQRWGLIMASSLNEVPVRDLAVEVALANGRILQSVALPKGQEVLTRVSRDPN